MDNDLCPFDNRYCKLKTARQRKRLQKEDSEKQLRAFHRLEVKLWHERQKLPLVLLEIPYQKGWIRTFRLRDDVARSSKATFYQTLLEKINTKDFSNDKQFLIKRRKKRKRVYEIKPQWLRSFTAEEWAGTRLKLTEAEKQLFYPKEYFNPFTKRVIIRFTFIEPWRYVLQIRPNMVTHARLLDEVLEQQIRQLDNHIETNNLRPRISKLIHGKVYHYHEGEKHRYYNPIKNKQLPDIVWEAMNNII